MIPQNDDSSPREARVLLAEDDAELRSLLTRRLTEAGFDVVPCEHGLALVDALDRSFGAGGIGDVDMVVTDIRMPGVSGLAVLAGLNAMGRPCPVVVMTAFADLETREEASRLRAAAVLEKPFDVERLLAIVKRVFERECAWADGWRSQGYPVDW